MDCAYKSNMITQPIRYVGWINRFALVISDVVGFSLAFFMTHFVLELSGEHQSYFADWLQSEQGYIKLLCFMGLVAGGICWFWNHFRHYTYRKPYWTELREILITLVALAILDLALVGLSKWELSRLGWGVLWLLVLVCVPLSRYVMKRVLFSLGVWQWPSVIIGCGDNAKECYLALNSEYLMGFDVVGFVAPDGYGNGSPVDGIPLIGESVESLSSRMKGVQYFIALEYGQRELRDKLLRDLAKKKIRNASVIPALRGVPLYGTDMSQFFSHEVMMLRVRNNLARVSSRMMKRTFDIVVSGLLLLLLSPLLFFIGWKISRDGGSPIFGHGRVGQHGRSFKCLKFRSMVMNSQEVLQELLDNDAEARAEWEKDFKLKNDPRITPIGHFIRKTSLDELPQLWNVLKGEMSLVGPRPVIKAELERYGDDVEYYKMAKPGMTGLWQVSGRNDIDYGTRVYLDGWYVKNWTLWHDIAIMFKTVGVVLNRDGAY